MNLWTSEETAKILIQLDESKLPFSGYSIVQEGGKLKLLGRGGSGEVYEARSRWTHRSNYACKVIGFGMQNRDSDCFNESVRVQKELGRFHHNVVKVYDHAELWVSLDEEDHVISAAKREPEAFSRTGVKLQFVVMEKISPVAERTTGGSIRITPEKLASGDEQEVLKLAYDIGTALQRAHNQNILHRDVKLENVFYSRRKKQYKLGDFGIAKRTQDGFAETTAFTRGYAAPEVRGSEERYDRTADIYSFGMMLYVLMNHLRFPDSAGYRVNSGAQYTPGYIVPHPANSISEGFYSVIAKACMYDPDQRYQSMEEMILDIEKLMYSESLGYKKKHKTASLAVGSIFFALGTAAWKLTAAPELVIRFGFWQYLFLAGCLGKGLQRMFRKDTSLLSALVLAVGIGLLVSSGFTWPKLVWLVCLTISRGIFSGYVSAAALIANFVSLMQQAGGAEQRLYGAHTWIAAAMISLAAVLLYQYQLLSMQDRKTVKMYDKKGLYWIFVCVVYGDMIVHGDTGNSAAGQLCRMIAVDGMGNALRSVDWRMVGMSGLGFSVLWIIRERILIRHQKRQMEKERESA